MPFRALKTTARFIILVGAVIATIWIYRAYLARSLPDLEVWHTYTPMAEFRAADFPDGISFAEYRKLETRLFDELDKQVFVTGASGNSDRYNRYDKNSIAYAGDAEQRWNRSFELRPPDAPRGGVLFIHGASDSPYSARAISRLFHDHGMYVLAVRLLAMALFRPDSEMHDLKTGGRSPEWAYSRFGQSSEPICRCTWLVIR